MKFTFDENKINIFTIIPYGKMREDALIKKCLDSWKRIPNSVLYLFDLEKDVRDTFPGMIENDPYYKVFNNEYLKPGEEPTETVPIYERFIYFDEFNKSVEHCQQVDTVIRKQRNISTDVIRLQMLQNIPNSVYIDSDMYLFDVDEFLRIFNDPSKTSYKDYTEGACAFCVKKGKNRSIILDEFMEYYNKSEIFEYDYSAFRTFRNLFFNKYGSGENNKMIQEYNNFDFAGDKPFFNHLFPLKYNLQQAKERGLLPENRSKKIKIRILVFEDSDFFNIGESFYGSIAEKRCKLFSEYTNSIKQNNLNNAEYDEICLYDQMFLCSNGYGDTKGFTDYTHITPYNDTEYIYCVNSLRYIYIGYKNNIVRFKEIINNTFLKHLMNFNTNNIIDIVIDKMTIDKRTHSLYIYFIK